MVSNQCPVSHGVDWLGQDFLAEPFDVLARLRAESPVLYDRELDHYIVTRYADVEEVLRDRATFLAANASAPVWPPVGGGPEGPAGQRLPPGPDPQQR